MDWGDVNASLLTDVTHIGDHAGGKDANDHTSRTGLWRGQGLDCWRRGCRGYHEGAVGLGKIWMRRHGLRRGFLMILTNWGSTNIDPLYE